MVSKPKQCGQVGFTKLWDEISEGWIKFINCKKKRLKTLLILALHYN